MAESVAHTASLKHQMRRRARLIPAARVYAHVWHAALASRLVHACPARAGLCTRENLHVLKPRGSYTLRDECDMS